MANLIPWSDDYAIGVDEVDQQHKYLFDLINEVLQSNEDEKLKSSLLKLYRYTREHFRAEEALMERAGYPQYEQHKEMHNLLILKLNDSSTETMNNPSRRDALDEFLTSWLVKHILEKDMDIGRFMQENKSASERV
ncbi:bacteriohemerythrin [Vibrio sp. JC009]|uniref:bacteriohemerythrin n=1 Tax=Vibrio sp. JC009 TaxID=2912314 RepID=UPI0023B09B8A|nr:bacteriohemerythrin [Vibrio sp. JC009]WED23011.1 bacteriohemerythrin [Vibrio sp. JC009]